jgi:hypothetical protein
MPAAAKRLDLEHPMDTEARLTRLEAITETVQRDVAEIKADLRRLDTKIDAVARDLLGKIDEIKNSLSALSQKVASSDGVMIKWMIGTALGTATVVIAFVSLAIYATR